MPSNKSSYDQHAVEWAKRRKKGHHPAHDFLEKPAMYELLPSDLTGLSILCLGCGSGEETDEMIRRGAGKIVGVDSSQGLIEQARYQYPTVDFVCADIQDWVYPIAEFDIVYSSLTFHYVDNWLNLLISIKQSLKVGGLCIFSAHHPIKWGAKTFRSKEKNQFLMGYTKSKTNNSYQIYGDYLNLRPVNDTLFGSTPIMHFHKPISAMVNSIIQSGLQITKMVEPKPIEKSKATLEDFYRVHSSIPLFVCWMLKK